MGGGDNKMLKENETQKQRTVAVKTRAPLSTAGRFNNDERRFTVASED